ncbi:DUF6113 family protein [Solicola gregarius]|uniref:DUF6113 family protein n=1 Tax=Solicola gregarius TaxID=2908642 RepID=A0AA46TJ37_9ACTN|nr:DUF6113 family protein [Solicola gregarius]UYM06205.1 DUF6113 family protein [Solicola gregarius]
MPVRRLVIRVALVLAGAVVCLAALVAHRHQWSLAGIDLPWGLVLALGTTYLVVRAGALLDAGRAGAVCVAAGWVVAFFYLFSGRPEGDYLFASDWLGYSMLIGGLVVVGAAVVVSMSGPPPAVRDPRHTI